MRFEVSKKKKKNPPQILPPYAMVLNSASGVLTLSRGHTWGASGEWENEFAHITTKIWVGRVTVHTERHTNKMNIILVDIRSFSKASPMAT